MSTTTASMDAMKANLTDRLTNHKAPFHAAPPDAAHAAIAKLESVEGAHLHRGVNGRQRGRRVRE